MPPPATADPNASVGFPLAVWNWRISTSTVDPVCALPGSTVKVIISANAVRKSSRGYQSRTCRIQASTGASAPPLSSKTLYSPTEDVSKFESSGLTGLLTHISVVEGRLCQSLGGGITCCLPCPLTDFTYPDSFQTMSLAADWISVVSTACCAFLLLSWTFLPVEKTHRHYLSICLTVAVVLMNVSSLTTMCFQGT